MAVQIAPSILSADFARLAEEAQLRWRLAQVGSVHPGNAINCRYEQLRVRRSEGKRVGPKDRHQIRNSRPMSRRDWWFRLMLDLFYANSGKI